MTKNYLSITLILMNTWYIYLYHEFNLLMVTDDQVADIFIKALTEVKFTKLHFMLAVQEAVIKGENALILPSLFYCVTFVNPSFLFQVILKREC